MDHIFILFQIRRDICIYKLFHGVWYPAGSGSAGSDTLQDFVRQGIRPRRTLFCGVSGPAEQVSAINVHNSAIVLRGLIPRKTKFLGVWYPAGSCSAGPDTPQAFVLRGIRPCWQIKTPWKQTKEFWELAIAFKGTLFENCLPTILKMFFLICWVWYPVAQLLNLKIYENSDRNSKFFRVWITGPYGINSWKKPEFENLMLLYP